MKSWSFPGSLCTVTVIKNTIQCSRQAKHNTAFLGMFYLGLGWSWQSRSALCACLLYSIKLPYSLWKYLELVLMEAQCLHQCKSVPFLPFPGVNGCMWNYFQLQIISLLCSTCLGHCLLYSQCDKELSMNFPRSANPSGQPAAGVSAPSPISCTAAAGGL